MSHCLLILRTLKNVFKKKWLLAQSHLSWYRKVETSLWYLLHIIYIRFLLGVKNLGLELSTICTLCISGESSGNNKVATRVTRASFACRLFHNHNYIEITNQLPLMAEIFDDICFNIKWCNYWIYQATRRSSGFEASFWWTFTLSCNGWLRRCEDVWSQVASWEIKIPSWELTYPIQRQLGRWVSFPIGGIWPRFLGGYSPNICRSAFCACFRRLDLEICKRSKLLLQTRVL